MLSVPMKIGIVRMRTELGLSFAWIFKKNTDLLLLAIIVKVQKPLPFSIISYEQDRIQYVSLPFFFFFSLSYLHNFPSTQLLFGLLAISSPTD